MSKDFAVICATAVAAVEMEFYEKEAAEKYAKETAEHNPCEEYWVVEIKSKYSKED